MSVVSDGTAIPERGRCRTPIPPDAVQQVSFFFQLSEQYIPFFLGLNVQTKKWVKDKLWFHDLMECQCPPNKIQICVRFQLLHTNESLDEASIKSKLKAINDNSNGMQNESRFLITGIRYGSQAVVVIQHDVHDENKRQSIADDLILAAKSFFTDLEKRESRKQNYPKVLDETLCQFYSDQKSHKSISPEWLSFSDCLRQHIYPFLSTQGARMWKPQDMQLYPIGIDENVTVLRACLKNAEEQVSDIMKDPFLQNILYINEHILAFQHGLSSLLLYMESYVLQGDDASLHNLCQYYLTTASLQEWISRKRREIRLLKQVLHGTDIKMETHETICQKFPDQRFRAFLLKTGNKSDAVIDEIRKRIGQEGAVLNRIYELATSNEHHLTRIKDAFCSFQQEANKAGDVISILSASDHLPDDAIIHFDPVPKHVSQKPDTPVNELTVTAGNDEVIRPQPTVRTRIEKIERPKSADFNEIRENLTPVQRETPVANLATPGSQDPRRGSEGTDVYQLLNVIGPEHPSIKCNGCRSRVEGFRYKCLECEDFDLCGKCEVMARHSEHKMLRKPFPTGNFIRWPSKKKKADQQESTEAGIYENAKGTVHPRVSCCACFSFVKGFRYKCVQCNYDLCGQCEAKAMHPGHIMLRINVPLVVSGLHTL